jgi:hypothetical protein
MSEIWIISTDHLRQILFGIVIRAKKREAKEFSKDIGGFANDISPP